MKDLKVAMIADTLKMMLMQMPVDKRKDVVDAIIALLEEKNADSESIMWLGGAVRLIMNGPDNDPVPPVEKF